MLTSCRRLDLYGFMLLVLVPAILTVMCVSTTVTPPSAATVQQLPQQVTCVPIARPRTQFAKWA